MAQYRVPVLEQFEWQQKITSILSTPPGSPAKGDRYIVGASPTGDWAGQANSIAWFDGYIWKFDVPAEGWVAYNNATNLYLYFTGSAWANLTHMQNTDQYLDQGGANEISAAQAKTAYDRRGSYDTDLKVILFELP